MEKPATFESVLGKRVDELSQASQEIADRHATLTTFQDVRTWLSDLNATTRLLEQFKNPIIEYNAAQKAALAAAEAQRTALPFLKRLSADKSAEEAYKKNIASAATCYKSIKGAIKTLEDLAATPPTSRADQKQELAELQTRKKELAIQKRTVTENMRQIRADARQRSANLQASRVIFKAKRSGFSGVVSRAQTASITSDKEKALSPQEDAKAEIETQLIAIDKRVNYLTRFTGDDPDPAEAWKTTVYRCAYCGRRVNPDEPCPACGGN